MDDYKNTPEGRAARQKYGDLLQRARPEPSFRHPRMPVSSRAKIFSPFAALRGYEEEIAEEGAWHLRIPRSEPSEEQKEALSAKLQQLRKGMSLKVTYFEGTPDSGFSRTVFGTVDQLDFAQRKLWIACGEKTVLGKERPKLLCFEDILELMF